ncbi:MAG: helix-turn-helix transcriptional regulator [Nanoarchaeota archaeon]|nr:helix-turn-helix transcriptional regulator [Nanoarchaeota archaeon]
MITNGELIKKNCLLYKNLDFLGKKWTIFILLKFYEEKCDSISYSMLKKDLPGITSKIISERLNELVKENILINEKKIVNKVLNSNYKLSQSGEELKDIVIALRDWGKKYGNCEYKDACCGCTF